MRGLARLWCFWRCSGDARSKPSFLARFLATTWRWPSAPWSPPPLLSLLISVCAYVEQKAARPWGEYAAILLAATLGHVPSAVLIGQHLCGPGNSLGVELLLSGLHEAGARSGEAH